MKYLLKLFLIWSLAILIVSFLDHRLLDERERYVYKDPSSSILTRLHIENRANFDGIHYLNIASRGYGNQEQVFFPLYPILIKFIAPVFGGYLPVAGLFITLLGTSIGAFLFYKLILLDYDIVVAKKTLLYWFVFPSSFFLGMVYTEGLFFALVVGCFYAARKQKWLLAGILGALAANTRFIGIMLFPALLYELYQAIKSSEQIISIKEKVKNFIFVSLIPIGLLLYLRYSWIMFQDPLKFLHVQPEVGIQHSSDRVIVLYQVLWRYLRMVLTTTLDPLYFAVWQEMLIGLLVIGLLVIAFKLKIRQSYLYYSILAFLTPTITGTFLSIPRFALVLFPIFIVLGHIKNKKLERGLLIAFGICFVISCAMFFRGYWVA